MTTALTIVSLLPEILGTNGDAANARVLAQRSRWAGIDARVVDVRSVDDLPGRVDAVVIGSGSDSDLVGARDILATMTDHLRRWTTEGVPVLAVGTGWELLSWGIELADGPVIEGLGIVAGRALPMATRATDDILVATKYGRLVGFENHARSYVGAEASPLGRVESGTGNGGGLEGLVMGNLVGTHLHGPVLARNPSLADHLLRSALSRLGLDYAPGARTTAVDQIARAARNLIAVRLGFVAE
ncbi:MAG: cobyric acid synthase [Ramlibacter sp.]|nr:cobyric acid synthase [Cryobacterium sp.]